MSPLHIAPNKPAYVALVDPEGVYDWELHVSRYQTTTGQELTLPRPAVVKLNALNVRPGEEIQITKVWSGKPGDSQEWTIALSTRSEMARAEAGEPDSLTAVLGAPIEASDRRKSQEGEVTPIRKPAKSTPAPSEQPKLFDRAKGTGTYGPAPQPAAAPAILPAVAQGSRKAPPAQIPANIAVAEILAFVQSDPNTANWSADARQDLCSTILIASFKAGYIGLWERK